MPLAQSYLAGMSDPFSGVFDSFARGAEFRRYKDQSELLRAQQEREMQMYDELDQLDFTNDDQLRQFVGRYGERAAAVKEQLNALSAEQQQAYVSDISRANALLKNGKPESAVSFAQTRAEAYRNAGDEEKAQEYAEIADFIAQNPQAAQQQLAMTYALMTPKDAADAYSKYVDSDIDQAKLPGEIRLTEAETTDKLASAKDKISQANERDTLLPHQQANIDADTGYKTAQGNKAQTEADLAPQELALQQEKVRLDNQISQLQLQLQSEKNETERQKLQVEISKLQNQQAQYEAGLTKEQVERNQKNQERMANYETGSNRIDEAISLVAEITSPENSKYLEAATGYSSMLPTVRGKTKDIEAKIETLKSMIFMIEKENMQGMGALTDGDREELKNVLASLDMGQTEAEFKKNLAKVGSMLQKRKKIIGTEYQDLLSEATNNNDGSIAGRSYMSILN